MFLQWLRPFCGDAPRLCNVSSMELHQGVNSEHPIILNYSRLSCKDPECNSILLDILIISFYHVIQFVCDPSQYKWVTLDVAMWD